MFRMKCLLTFLALFVNVAHSWDFAVTVGDQIEFYNNGTKTSTKGILFGDLTALAYDAVHNMLLFVDRQNDNASIFSYNLDTKQYQPLVRKRTENILGLAFDPIESLLFWTNLKDKSIYWMSLKKGFTENNPYGNRLLQLDDEYPRAITVDSCRQYIYWTNTNVKNRATIERAKFDGSDRQIIIDTDVHMPVSITIDQKTKRLYWADKREGIHFSIESSDLDGKNRRTVVTGTHHNPNALTVSKDFIYWVDLGYKSVWRVPKDNKPDQEPTQLSNFDNELPGIVANYNIEDQTEGVEDCQLLKNMLNNKTAINDTFNIPRDVGLFCLHGTEVVGQLTCKCSPGYSGERCEIFDCHNLCFNGDCAVQDGKAQCRCKPGYTGDRCQNDVCLGFCVNNGVCSVDNNKAKCSCASNYSGDRCEKRINDTPNVVYVKVPCECPKQNNVPKTVYVDKPCNCSNPALDNSASITDLQTDGSIACDDSWDRVRNPILMALGVVCGLLCVACAVLVTKIMQLKKRPRIKKRIIVNKNVTPLTARPDSCEITIENCCNMNICETPCFEPRSTIRPSLLEAKPGKEEKKNLIANMEYPEDY